MAHKPIHPAVLQAESELAAFEDAFEGCFKSLARERTAELQEKGGSRLAEMRLELQLSLVQRFFRGLLAREAQQVLVLENTQLFSYAHEVSASRARRHRHSGLC